MSRSTTYIANFKTYMSHKSHVAISILLILHIVGIIGLATSFRGLVQPLTPVNLLISAALLFLNHGRWRTPHIVAVVVAFLVGFFIEVVGVHTGVVFGQYWYGPTLGPKLFQVPLMIGVNWAILVYASGILVSTFRLPYLARALAAALIMVGLDYLIEPMAMVLDFWQWHRETIPLRNYVGWFATAFALQLLFHKLVPPTNNKVGPALLAIQAAFFLLLNLLL